jgi:hypothetical protein
MEPQTTPEFLITQMRVLTMKEMTFFYVTAQPVPFDRLDESLDALLSSLYIAKAQTHLTEAGPDIVRYYPAGTDRPGLFVMEVGVLVKPGTEPAGEAQVKLLPPYRCASLLLWGGPVAHIGQTYETLSQAIQTAGLERTGECREYTYWFESVDSPNNLMGIYMGLESL